MRRRRCGLRERSTDLSAQQVVVVVIKRRNIEIDLGGHQTAVPGFVADKTLRGKFSIADGAYKQQWIGADQPGSLKVFLDPGRGAHGPRDGRPHRLPRTWRPQQPHRWLNLEPGVVVMYEFCS